MKPCIFYDHERWSDAWSKGLSCRALVWPSVPTFLPISSAPNVYQLALVSSKGVHGIAGTHSRKNEWQPKINTMFFLERFHNILYSIENPEFRLHKCIERYLRQGNYFPLTVRLDLKSRMTRPRWLNEDPFQILPEFNFLPQSSVRHSRAFITNAFTLGQKAAFHIVACLHLQTNQRRQTILSTKWINDLALPY